MSSVDQDAERERVQAFASEAKTFTSEPLAKARIITKSDGECACIAISDDDIAARRDSFEIKRIHRVVPDRSHRSQILRHMMACNARRGICMGAAEGEMLRAVDIEGKEMLLVGRQLQRERVSSGALRCRL